MLTIPKINTPYWLALMMASIFGTNTGDWVADVLHIGHLQGLPWLAGILAIVFLVERIAPVRSALFFWAAIITVRTAATNLGDAFHSYHIPFSLALPILTLAFVASVIAYKANGGGIGEDGTPKVDWLYWLCMTMAGAWGTLGGDFVSFAFKPHSLHLYDAIALLSLIVAALFWFGRKERLLKPYYYWLTVGFIRAAGTSIGDSGDHLMGINTSTIVTGAIFIAMTIAFYGIKKENSVAQ